MGGKGQRSLLRRPQSQSSLSTQVHYQSRFPSQSLPPLAGRFMRAGLFSGVLALSFTS